MPNRKYFQPEQPPNPVAQARIVAILNERVDALFEDGGDPSAWRLPSGHTLAEASGHELMTVGMVLGHLGAHKLEEAAVATQRTANSVYRVEVNGQHVGEIRRTSEALSGGWYRDRHDGRRYFDSGKAPFKTRDGAVDALVTRFA